MVLFKDHPCQFRFLHCKHVTNIYFPSNLQPSSIEKMSLKAEVGSIIRIAVMCTSVVLFDSKGSVYYIDGVYFE